MATCSRLHGMACLSGAGRVPSFRGEAPSLHRTCSRGGMRALTTFDNRGRLVSTLIASRGAAGRGLLATQNRGTANQTATKLFLSRVRRLVLSPWLPNLGSALLPAA